KFNRFVEQTQRFFIRFPSKFIAVRHSTKVDVVRAEALSRFALGTFDLCQVHMAGNFNHNCARHLVLNHEYVLQFAIVSIGPTVSTSCGLDQLGCNANAITGSANTPFNYVAHTELSPDLTHVYRFVLVLEARIASDHEQLRKPRQLSDNVFSDAITEVFLLLVTG